MSGNGIKCFTNVYWLLLLKVFFCAGIFELMPSKTCCVRLVSKVFVECSGRTSCCMGARRDIRVHYV